MQEQRLALYFYAIKVEVFSNDAFVTDNLKRDFSYFLSERAFKQTVTIEADLQGPHFDAIKGFRFMKHLKGTCYGLGDIRYIVYKDALCCYDARQDRGSVRSLDKGKLYRLVYYMLISKVGEKHDLEGLHRIHALGLDLQGEGCIIAAPMKRGKTTLGLELLKNNTVQLFSEDTPLLDATGFMHPFPIRIAIADTRADDIPSEFKRTLNDECHGKKVLVDLACFGIQKIARGKMAVKRLFFCERTSAHRPRIEKIGKLEYFIRLFSYIVLGKDVPQRAENIFRISLRSLPLFSKILFGRIQTMLFICRKTEGFLFYMTTDISKNASFLTQHALSLK